jgi:phosphomethylpyrimidine synthase
MKITQEVREFAQRQTAQNRPEDGSEARVRVFAKTEEVEAAMAEMSDRFREEGGEIYLPTG